MTTTAYDKTSALGPTVRGAIVADLLSDALLLLKDDQDSARVCIEQAVALVGYAPAPTTMIGGLAPWQKAKVSQFIEAELSGPMRIEQAARVARLSANYFSRAFKVTFGLSFSNYLTARRVERAKQLLLTTQTPICQIAFDCGFSDQAHLSRVVRRNLGTTPNAWRRAQGDLAEATARYG